MSQSVKSTSNKRSHYTQRPPPQRKPISTVPNERPIQVPANKMNSPQPARDIHNRAHSAEDEMDKLFDRRRR
jgi:hypothetical protein